MLLCDTDIRDLVREGSLGVEPYRDQLMQPASLDVRLDKHFLVFNNHRDTHIDPSVEQNITRACEVDEGEPFVLHPGEFALGSTLEHFHMPNSVASRVEGKSSLGRLGLMVHSTAGFVDPGFRGHITLELSNVATLPIKLWPGMRIGQMCFMAMTGTPERPYGSAGLSSRYQDQRGPTPSRAYLNFQHGDVG